MDDPIPATRLDELLTFWFGSAGPDPDVSFRASWFQRDDAFDATLRASFGDLAEQALREPEAFDSWRQSARGMLGLMLLLDQLSRNLFRGTPRAFEADPLARELARDALARGLDTEVPHVARIFFYLPFEHSEALADQEYSVELFTRLAADGRAVPLPQAVLGALEQTLDYARKHLEVIVEFGRFPHRNTALSRSSTDAERAWLAAGGGF